MNTVKKFEAELGHALGLLAPRVSKSFRSPLVQADELVVKLRALKQYAYVWIAIDPETKFVPCFHVGGRTRFDAHAFLESIRGTCGERITINTDAYAAYEDQIGEVFGCNAKHNVQRKRDGVGARQLKVRTSFVERMNKTVRAMNARCRRATDTYSESPRWLQLSLNITFFVYNFARVHKSLRVTPAMQAGIADHIWSLSEVIERAEVRTIERSVPVIQFLALRVAA